MEFLTDEQLKEKINNKETFLVDIYADWCEPCKVLGPIFEKTSSQLDSENHNVKFYKFNIEDGRELGIELGVRSIPTIIGFSNGESKIFTTGVKSQEQLTEMANSLSQ